MIDGISVQNNFPVQIVGSATDVATLESTPQDFTAGWVDLGSEIDCRGYNTLGIWLTLDINDTTDARVRVLAKHTNGGGEEYSFPIDSISTTAINITPQYIEFTNDADQNVILTVKTDNIASFIQVQIQAGTVGATAGQIDAAYYTLGVN